MSAKGMSLKEVQCHPGEHRRVRNNATASGLTWRASRGLGRRANMPESQSLVQSEALTRFSSVTAERGRGCGIEVCSWRGCSVRFRDRRRLCNTQVQVKQQVI